MKATKFIYKVLVALLVSTQLFAATGCNEKSGSPKPVSEKDFKIYSETKKYIGFKTNIHSLLHSKLDDLYDGNIYYGFGANTDIVTASVEAYIDCINKFRVRAKAE